MSKTIEDRAKEYADKYCNGESVIISRLMKDAIEGSYIKGATDQRAIDEKELQPQWISVDERLPKYGQDVLVSIEGTSVVTTSFRDSLCVNKDSHDFLRLFDDKEYTHWMPLPPPPSGDKL